MKFVDDKITGWSELVEVPVMGGVLRFRGMPLTWDLDTEKEFPPPVEPEKLELTDEEKKTVDDHYGKLVDRYNRLVAVILMDDCIEPGQIEFDTIREDYDTLEQFAEARNKELAGAGCRAAEILGIADAIKSASTITDENVEQARADFLDPAGTLPPDLPISANANG